MRRDFRVKVDISKIFLDDARQYSWVYIDSMKIHYIHHLAGHVEKLFNVKKPFHFLSVHEDSYIFLPFEEDVRVLENNDTVLIVPGTGINSNNNNVLKNFEEYSQKSVSEISEAIKTVEKESNGFSEKSSYASEKSSVQNSVQNTIETASFNDSLYRTALYETAMDETKDPRITEDNYTEENSAQGESPVSNKRKRIRKRKQKKSSEVVPESDASLVETFDKKPRIIDSILISSGKHIRFKGIDDEDNGSVATNENNVHEAICNGDNHNNQGVTKDLSVLLNLRQSSTPLTFTHKRMKRDYKPEPIEEQEIIVETSQISNKSNVNLSSSKAVSNLEKSKDNSLVNKSNADDTVSFKVFRIGEDYTPQLSSVILAKVLSSNLEGSEYTMKIIHGKEQLQDPEGKFSLPKDEENDNDEEDDIITLEKSKLLEFTKVKAIGCN